MLLDLRNGLVGEDDLVPHASPPLRHDGLAGEGFNGGVLRRAISSASSRTSSSSVTGQGKLMGTCLRDSADTL